MRKGEEMTCQIFQVCYVEMIICSNTAVEYIYMRERYHEGTKKVL